LFEDVRVEIENHGDGEVTLYVIVTERPFVTSVDFEGNKKIKTPDLKDKLDERGVEIPRNVPMRSSQLGRIESAIKEVYDSEGFRSAQVSYSITEVSANKKKVVYLIDEGGKIKIKEIGFVGNNVFSRSKLRGVLEKTKQKSLRNYFGDKIVYTREGWDEDRDTLRKFYGNRGYIDVKIGEPVLELVAKKPDAKTLKKKKYRMHITIPIEEGEPYTLGSFEVTGVEIFSAEGLTRAFEAKKARPIAVRQLKMEWRRSARAITMRATSTHTPTKHGHGARGMSTSLMSLLTFSRAIASTSGDSSLSATPRPATRCCGVNFGSPRVRP